MLSSRGRPIWFFAQVIAKCPLPCTSCVFFSQVTYSELLTKFRNFLRVLRVSSDSSSVRSMSVCLKRNAVVVVAAAAAGHLARRHRRPARSYRCRLEPVVFGVAHFPSASVPARRGRRLSRSCIFVTEQWWVLGSLMHLDTAPSVRRINKLSPEIFQQLT